MNFRKVYKNNAHIHKNDKFKSRNAKKKLAKNKSNVYYMMQSMNSLKFTPGSVSNLGMIYIF